MTIQEIAEGLLGFISDEINVEDITNIEYQCGGCWIDTKDGKTYSLTLTETEND